MRGSKEKKKKREPLLLQHVTRMTPKRADELLDGGSIYWVIKGQIVARQKLVELKPVQKNGKPHCALVYEPKLILVARRASSPVPGLALSSAEGRAARHHRSEEREESARRI